MAEPRSEMAGSASQDRASVAVGDNSRHGRVLVGKPVGRIRDVINLLLRVGLRAARNMNRPISFINHRLNFIAHGKRPRNIGKVPGLRGLSAGAKSGEERKQYCQNEYPGGNSHGTSRATRLRPRETQLRSFLRFAVNCRELV